MEDYGRGWKQIDQTIVKVKNQLDATKYLTCFGHQYAHHQEYN
jgi:hypothetical protein